MQSVRFVSCVIICVAVARRWTVPVFDTVYPKPGKKCWLITQRQLSLNLTMAAFLSERSDRTKREPEPANNKQ